MSGPVILDRARLALALSEVEEIRKALPENALTALAQEVVKRVAENLAPPPPHDLAPTSEEIDALSEALMAADDSAAIALIEQARRNGASYDALCHAYLAEASRRVGLWWEEDKVSFYRVTIAAGRIYAILRILRLQRIAPVPDLRRSAIFAAVPGEDHTLGITIAADMARELGWDIELLVGHSHDELAEVLMKRETGLIGLSASTRRSLPALIKLIVALRISNPAAKILICGQIATHNLNLDGITGADAVAPDLDSALAAMAGMIEPTATMARD